MIRVALSDKTVSLEFHHYSQVEAAVVPDPLIPSVFDTVEVRCTKCEIFTLDNDRKVKIGEGIARCSPLDNFNKAAGRRLALTKALGPVTHEKEGKKIVKKTNYILGRDDREMIWTTYFASLLPPKTVDKTITGETIH